MRLSTLLLLCLFLFCCTHLTERTAWRLRVQEGSIAALSLLLLALSAFPVQLSASVSALPRFAAAVDRVAPALPRAAGHRRRAADGAAVRRAGLVRFTTC